MDRLTVRINGKAVSATYDEVFIFAMGDKTFSAYSETIERLADYEETGLSPKEIAALQAENKRLHELVDTIESTIKAF